ncbi:uncharacterized protein Z518_08985 [Rhinocladiella mackenziei CBS 650.93]|uniref:Uncharacterized protein n=1 Tax=Rhinocladiella mackenziei CBS 650.93 TaxID=1442369 RepID=A0A0D2IXD2_9EURO|nr:uncharacterized protein Z518_08985 [Rhinocladiella mackenziei CBS 650.93]KIX01260.1 hypothetical protein Z518_08985 [Rhinocladiella mackenziei CBS 650.93]
MPVNSAIVINMGPVRNLWMRWKMLRLPWRKKFLIGQDLSGNTFWEFKDALNHNRWRRMVKSGRRTHLSDVQISPQWHQWLRQTRTDPPTLQEQAADVQRIATLKYNARLADERWAAKAQYIEKPKPAATSLLTGNFEEGAQPDHAPGRQPQLGKTPSRGGEPWKKVRETGANPGANWEPASWVPGTSKR